MGTSEGQPDRIGRRCYRALGSPVKLIAIPEDENGPSELMDRDGI
jgi:hypothetical protein